LAIKGDKKLAIKVFKHYLKKFKQQPKCFGQQKIKINHWINGHCQ
jgi:hypothetical protein